MGKVTMSATPNRTGGIEKRKWNLWNYEREEQRRALHHADMGGATPCERTHWCPRWSSLRATKRVRGVPTWAGRRNVNASTGALGRAPWGARNV